MTYNAENMQRMLGSEGTDRAAEVFAAHLIANGWELEENDENQIVAIRDGEVMTEYEWQEALRSCVWES